MNRDLLFVAAAVVWTAVGATGCSRNATGSSEDKHAADDGAANECTRSVAVTPLELDQGGNSEACDALAVRYWVQQNGTVQTGEVSCAAGRIELPGLPGRTLQLGLLAVRHEGTGFEIAFATGVDLMADSNVPLDEGTLDECSGTGQRPVWCDAIEIPAGCDDASESAHLACFETENTTVTDACGGA